MQFFLKNEHDFSRRQNFIFRLNRNISEIGVSNPEKPPTQPKIFRFRRKLSGFFLQRLIKNKILEKGI